MLKEYLVNVSISTYYNFNNKIKNNYNRSNGYYQCKINNNMNASYGMLQLILAMIMTHNKHIFVLLIFKDVRKTNLLKLRIKSQPRWVITSNV